MSKKKATPKPKKAAPDIAKDKLPPIVKRLESGASALIAESKKLGFSTNDRLRAALREFLGGPKPYRAMIAKAMTARAKKEPVPQKKAA